MKKFIALLLAVLMVLSGTLALAEAAPIDAITITSDVTIDREAATKLMAATGMDEGQIGLYDILLAVLDAAKDQLVIDENGLQYNLTLNDQEVLTLAGDVTSEGLVFGSNIISNHLLTLSNKSIATMLKKIASRAKAKKKAQAEAFTPAVTEALQNYANEFIAQAGSAFSVGAAETGEFTFDGATYNTKTPMNVDMPVLLDAFKALVEKLNSDETVKAALETTSKKGAKLDLTIPEDLTADKLPAVDVALYTNVDASGAQGEEQYYVATVTEAGKTDPSCNIGVYVNGNTCNVECNFPENDITATTSVIIDANNCNVQSGLYNSDGLIGALNCLVESEEDTVVTMDLYIGDPVNPIATDVTTITDGGQRDFVISTAGKTIIALESLAAGEDNDALTGLGVDLLTSGMGALSAATEAVPELGSLTSMLLGGDSSAAN